MACPKCGCKVTYPFLVDDVLMQTEEYEQDACSACGYIFYIMDEDDEELEAINGEDNKN